MAGSKKSRTFDEQETKDIRALLHKIVLDKGFNTESTYSANEIDYPDHLIPFIEKHVAYLKNHPKLDPDQYIANLRLMTKIR